MALPSMAPGVEASLVMVVAVLVLDLPSLSETSDPHRKGLSPFQKRTMKGLGEEGT